MSDEKPRVIIYTDGGADPNPGPGGWGVVLIDEKSGTEKELSGADRDTTNNRMELIAAIEALRALKVSCRVTLYTDSEYLRRGITEWLPDWVARGWRRKKGEIQNMDLWRELAELAGEQEIEWNWVKGHAGNRYNERADRLATREIRRLHAAGVGEHPTDAEIFLVVSARGEEGMWAARIRSDGDEHILFGREYDMTSNQLDVLAAAEALSGLPDGASVRVYSLSDYLRNGASQWIHAWKQRGWLTKQGEPVKNQELWLRLDGELGRLRVEWPPAKDDQTLEFAFEELARRAQEEFDQHDGWDGE